MLNSYSFAQANNHISIDKLSFTLTNFEISGDFRSIPTINWKTNLTINGFEMQIDEREFQEFSHQINNDNKIVIDRFKATVSMINNELKISNARFSSPFLIADIKADLLIDINNPEDTWLKSSTVKLDVLSSALERLVFELEKELGEEFPRRGKSILLEAFGSLKDPRVKGMVFEKSAETYFDLSDKALADNQVEESISHLKDLLSHHENDSLSSKAQYKLSVIYLNWKNDLSAGLNALQQTIEKYPNSKHAVQATKEIENFPAWVFNKAESLRRRKDIKESISNCSYLVENYSDHPLSAKAQYLIGDIYMNDLRDFGSAINEYRKVIDNYAGSSQESEALFMIGYIYANILKDSAKAKNEYQTFLTRFPKHDLSPSVQFELDFLGKDINEIPALKHITS